MKIPFFLIPLISTVHAQGPLVPSGPPGPTQKSLQEIWDRIGGLETLVVDQQQQISLLQQQNTLLLQAGNVELVWRYETASTDSPVGPLSLAFSPSGVPAIAYCDGASGHLKYCSRSTGGWIVTTVDTLAGSLAYPSLAFAPSGKPVIAFHRDGDAGSGNGLAVATYDGSVWQIANVDEGDTGYRPCLAFSPDGLPHIAYDDTEDNGIGYAVDAGAGSWTASTIPAPGGRAPSLAFGPEGQPAIAFQIGSYSLSLQLARYSAGIWNTEVIVERDPEGEVTDEFGAVCLGFGPAGLPVITYDYYDAGGYLFYSTMDQNGVWHPTSISTGSDWGFVSSFSFGPTGEPMIGFTVDNDDGYESNIAFAALHGGLWTSEYLGITLSDKIDSSRAVLSLAPGGQPAIAFSNGSVRFAEKGPYR
ncbi:hypothetical protein [Luteolibacter marinus]|uniref:hypothetical protein n=1 Tax=Luteolibacter marinus TaxID=2776705 RepID=UPI001868C22F|nr:hypothetical protein [Luteolibacter marinus]